MLRSGTLPVNIELHYTLTQDDYLEAQEAFTKNAGLTTRAGVYGLPAIGITWIAAAVINFLSTRNWPVTVFGVLCGTLLLFWRRYSLTRTFAKEKKLQQQFDVQINDQGIELSNLNGRNLSLWPAIDKFAESKSLFVLFCGQRTFHALPKRAFVAGQEEQFRELLRQKIPSGQ